MKKGVDKKPMDVIVISSESEDGDAPKGPLANPHRPLPQALITRRRRVIIIDDDSEEAAEHGTASNPNKKVRRYRMAVHTMPKKQREPQADPTETPQHLAHNKTMPLPVQLFDVVATASKAGVAGPSGTIPVPAAGPSSLRLEGSDYEFSDIEPDLLAALCHGT